MPDMKSGRWLSQFLIVLASLLCGLAVWIVVQLNERGEITLEIELVPRSVDARVDLEILRNRVPVRFSYPATEVAKMKADSFQVAVEFPDIIERFGQNQEISGDRVLSPDMVKARPGRGVDLSAQSVVATEILVNQVDWRASLRMMPVTIQPVVVGTPSPGYEYDPNQVAVEDAQDLYVLLTQRKQAELTEEGVEEYIIKTEPISIDGKMGTLREMVMLDLEEGVSLMPDEPVERLVSIQLEEATVTRRLADVTVHYELFSAREDLTAILKPEVVDVLVTGPASAVNQVTPEMINFALYGVVEEAGETRIVALEARVNDPDLGKLIPSTNVETDPKSIEVRIEGPRDTVTPSPSPTPVPSPSPLPSPSATPEPSPTPAPSPTQALIEKEETEPQPTLATDDVPTT